MNRAEFYWAAMAMVMCLGCAGSTHDRSAVLQDEPRAPTAVDVSAGPVLVRPVEPVYPNKARRSRVEGHVIVRGTLDESGRIAGLRIVSSEPSGMFDESVLDAVPRWRYRVAPTWFETNDPEVEARVAFRLHPCKLMPDWPGSSVDFVEEVTVCGFSYRP